MTPPPAAAGTMDDKTSLTAISSRISTTQTDSSSATAAAADAAADTNTKPLPAPTLDAGKQTAPVRQCPCRNRAKNPATAHEPPSTTTTTTTNTSSAPHSASTAPLAAIDIKPTPPPVSTAAAAPMNVKTSPTSAKMIFSDMYRSPRSPLSKIRHSVFAAPLPLPHADYDVDLLSKDKAKQKEAVRRHLEEKVRNDWDFVWPPVSAAASVPAPVPPQSTENGDDVAADPTPQPPAETSPSEPQLGDDSVTAAAERNRESTEEALDDGPDSDAESVYSTVSEDPVHYRPRLDWVSDLSDDEAPPMSLSPFRFDTPEAIGAAVKASVVDKQAQRRRAVREEMQWNEGLACFEARRNAWTGAKTVRVRQKPISPSTSFASLSPKRLFQRTSVPPSPAHHSSPPQQRRSNDASTTNSDGYDSKDGSRDLSAQRSKDSSHSTTSAPSTAAYSVETLLPLAPPLLPPNNPMRASITPAVYLSLYEKVILHNLTPSCPVNLSDMIRACVTGWKRDGEWPPRPAPADPMSLVAVRKKKRASAGAGDGLGTARRMSFGFLGRGGGGEKAGAEESKGVAKGIRGSLQRVLGIGHHAATPNGKSAVA
ncbi:hypothetical protein D7B24_000877 [Verticillium nonalfalfae]|uniref:Gag1-like clamp domain-containing protein n=1 Tax=Verticillium nonalfalfae TaxID=1051616 RepID=A0A3M9Y3W6_9PEZI|nr:uncharacterized protein D7B24_000877 [Verticillium nonalfalfae]RNJ54138.1 hypothetical protein D7B24_000877 [Verticillium nonalfalfae]